MNLPLRMQDKQVARSISKPADPATVDSKTTSNWLALSASIISLVGLVFTLFGYGVGLAAEGMFGMPHGALTDTGFDLIDLASVGLMQFADGGIRTLGGLSFYVDLYASAWPFLLGLTLAWLIFMVWLWRRKPKGTARKTFAVAGSNSPNGAEKLNGIVGQRRLATVVLALIPLSPLLVVASVWLIVVVVAMIGIVPAIGMNAGMAHINQWVVAPERCLWRLNREQWLQRIKADKKEQGSERIANCVAVVRDGKVVAKGRVVFMTSKSVILFDPSDGSVRKVPSAEAIIEVLPAL